MFWPKFHMVNWVTCMNIGTILEKAIKKCLPNYKKKPFGR